MGEHLNSEEENLPPTWESPQCTSSLNCSQEEVSVTREPVSSKCRRFYPRTSLLFGGFAHFYFKYVCVCVCHRTTSRAILKNAIPFLETWFPHWPGGY